MITFYICFSLYYLFLWMTVVGGGQEGGESKEKQLKRSLGKQLCRQALHWISI